MKKFAIIFLFSLISGILSGQIMYLGAGYNVSSGAYDNFNFVIDRYNETRDWLDEDMDNINMTHGMSFDLGFATPGFLGGMGLQYNRAKVSSKGHVNDVEYQRDLKLHQLNIPFELAYVIQADEFAWAPGMGFNFLMWKYLTRTGEVDDIDDIDYYVEPADMGIHAKLFIKLFFGGVEDGGWGLVAEPYYNIGLIGSDLTELNRRINPDTYMNDNLEEEVFSNFGLRLMFLYKEES